MRPRLLDLFCGAGGASLGYAAAGFEVVGVDIDPQPTYPFEFVQADALDILAAGIDGFAAIHASPPCQGYSPHVYSRGSRWVPTRGLDEPRLIGVVRDGLRAAGLPYVIENVMGAAAEMHPNLFLCGSMFGLPIQRHRLFEATFRVEQPMHRACWSAGLARRYAEERGWEPRDMTVTGKGRRAGTKERWMQIIGWPADVPVTQHGLAESIPMRYTEHVGAHLLRAVQS